MKRIKKIAFSGILVSLSVVVLFLGSIFEVLDLTVAAVASFITLLAIIELGSYFPLLIYLASSVLGILLLPNKYGALIYCLFYGFYPILKIKIEAKFKSKFLKISLKLLLFVISQIAIELLWIFLFSAIYINEGIWLIAFSIILSVFTFIVFDMALSVLSRLYTLKWRKYIKKFL